MFSIMNLLHIILVFNIINFSTRIRSATASIDNAVLLDGWFEAHIIDKVAEEHRVIDESIVLLNDTADYASECVHDYSTIILTYDNENEQRGNGTFRVDRDNANNCRRVVNDARVIRVPNNGYRFVMPNRTATNDVTPHLLSYGKVMMHNNYGKLLKKQSEYIPWGAWVYGPGPVVQIYESSAFMCRDSTFNGYEAYATYAYDSKPEIGYIRFKLISWYMGGHEFHVQFDNEVEFRKHFYVKVVSWFENQNYNYDVSITPTHPTAFRVLFAADPQPYRVLDPTRDPNSDVNTWISEIATSVDILSKLKNVEPPPAFTLVNGDLTEFGRDAQLDAYHDHFDKAMSHFTFEGLGNHDYANNVHDCYAPGGFGLDRCAMNMVAYMVKRMKEYNKRASLYEEHYTRTGVNNYYGSFAYAFSYGQYRFYQLHNFPSYTTNLQDAAWIIEVQSSIGWLENQFTKYKDHAHVLNLHDYTFHDNADYEKIFRDLLRKYNVRLVFAGHTHYFDLTENAYEVDGVLLAVSTALFNSDQPGVWYADFFDNGCVEGGTSTLLLEGRKDYAFKQCSK